MTAYPDTSFLCAVYRQQDNTEKALAHRASMKHALPVTSLLLFEFRHSVRFQTWLHHHDATKGYGAKEGAKMLGDLQSDLDSGVVALVPADWAKVHSLAEQLSSQHALKGGHRSLDTLHVATALALGAKELLTFDARQRVLAKTAGLRVKP